MFKKYQVLVGENEKVLEMHGGVMVVKLYEHTCCPRTKCFKMVTCICCLFPYKTKHQVKKTI